MLQRIPHKPEMQCAFAYLQPSSMYCRHMVRRIESLAAYAPLQSVVYFLHFGELIGAQLLVELRIVCRTGVFLLEPIDIALYVFRRAGDILYLTLVARASSARMALRAMAVSVLVESSTQSICCLSRR